MCVCVNEFSACLQSFISGTEWVSIKGTNAKVEMNEQSVFVPLFDERMSENAPSLTFSTRT